MRDDETWLVGSKRMVGNRCGNAGRTGSSNTRQSRVNQTRYLVVVEETTTGFSAHSPDLPRMCATGSTREEAQHLITDAMSFHVEGMRAEGLPVPEPHTSSAYVDLPA